MSEIVQDTDDLSIEGEAFEAADEADAPEIVGPSTIREEELLQALYKDLYRGEQAKAVLAEAQMRQVAELNQQFEHRSIDGLGCLVARIPLEVYLAWMAREGPEFWHERSNLDYFAHRAEGVGNPGFLIKTKMRPSITVDRKISRRRGAAEGVNSAGAVVSTSSAPVTDRAAEVVAHA